MLRSPGVDPDAVLAGQAESPGDRFRVFDDLTQAVLPDLLRSPAADRLDLRGFDLAEVREQLAWMGADETVGFEVADAYLREPVA